MPLRMVSPDSSSTSEWNDGSSATILPSAMPSFSAFALSLGVTDTEITGAGNTIGSSVAGLSSSHSVWPVCTFLRPTSATMSPACARVDQRAVVGVHLHHAADALGLAGERVEQRHALGDRARVDAREGQAAEAVVHDLERERAHGLLGSTMA